MSVTCQVLLPDYCPSSNLTGNAQCKVNTIVRCYLSVQYYLSVERYLSGDLPVRRELPAAVSIGTHSSLVELADGGGFTVVQVMREETSAALSAHAVEEVPETKHTYYTWCIGGDISSFQHIDTHHHDENVLLCAWLAIYLNVLTIVLNLITTATVLMLQIIPLRTPWIC